MTNPFLDPDLAAQYDTFFTTREGKLIDYLEKSALDKLLQKVPRGKLLEVGCGTGHWSEFFASLGFEVTGIDSSLPMLNISRKKEIPFTQFIHSSGETYYLPKPQNLKQIKRKSGPFKRNLVENNNWKFDSLAIMFSLEYFESKN